MFPWFWIWTPRFDFPLSGNVTQDVATDWFFSGIRSKAGNAALEKAIFNHATYGSSAASRRAATSCNSAR